MAILIQDETGVQNSPHVKEKKPIRFHEYYRFYLSQHQNKYCRRLHLLGMLFAVGVFIGLVTTSHWWLSVISPVTIYPFAWIGHFVFEKNTPATFRNPFFAALSDFVMTWDIIRGRITA